MAFYRYICSDFIVYYGESEILGDIIRRHPNKRTSKKVFKKSPKSSRYEGYGSIVQNDEFYGRRILSATKEVVYILTQHAVNFDFLHSKSETVKVTGIQ